MDHAGGHRTQPETAELLRQLRTDETELAHLAQQFAVEDTGLVALEKSRLVTLVCK